MHHVIVVGAGQAGSSCVAKLRNGGFDGRVTLIGAEPVIPYQRPPLSKGYLLGDMTLDRLFLRPESFYSDHNIDLRLSTKVDGLNPDTREIVVGGEVLHYDDLVLATGSSPRRLPAAIGGNLEGVFTVRDLADVDAMAPYFEKGARALIVGGGYIGLEAAAVAAKLGLDVTLVEMSDRILQRVAAPQTSDYFRSLHSAHGVKILEGVGLEHLKGTTTVTAAQLSDGTELEVDFVVVGVGIEPNTTLAHTAGIEIENGVKTDAFGKTSAAHVWAAGDCASFPYGDARIRLESVPHAIEQAELIAENIMGADKKYRAKPWFWSDQYDVKLQIAGLNSGYTSVVARVGEGQSASFWYYRDGRLLAVDAMNDPRAYMIGKRLIEAGKSADPAVVSDNTSDLKALLNA